MRCMACGGEMTLVSVVNEDTMPVPGFEQHTFTCSECHDTERRLVFAKRGGHGDTEPAAVEAAPSIALDSTAQDQDVEEHAQGLLPSAERS
jgi:hypothetical protein